MAEAVIAKFREITSKTYADQAKWYLNAFWADIQNSNPEEPEQVWKTVEAFIAVDLKNGKNGNELNEVLAHHFLQKIGRTLTALQLRAELRKIDLDANGEMALIEYLLFEHKRDVVACCNNPQGGGADPAELKAAEEQLNKISEANDELQVKLVDQKALEEASKVAEAEAKKREAEAVAAETAAKASEAEALAAEDAAKKTEAAAVEAATQAQVAENKLREAEDAVRVIEAEAKAVDAELQAEKDKYNGEIDRLTALTTDDTVGIVKRNMAVQQLAQLKGSDPMPLQKAKITQEAVVRRVAKARTAAEAETAVAAVKTTEAHAAREVAEADRVKSEAARAKAVAEREAAEAERAKAQAARTSAEQAREAAEEGTRQIEAAIEDIQQKMKEAEEALQKLKSIEGSPHGAIWWMEREITEKKKYLPQRFQ